MSTYRLQTHKKAVKKKEHKKDKNKKQQKVKAIMNAPQKSFKSLFFFYAVKTSGSTTVAGCEWT